MAKFWTSPYSKHLKTTNNFDSKIEICVVKSLENIVGEEENVGYQHFLLFPTMFSKAFFSRGVKSRDCVVKSQPFTTQS